MCQLLHPKPNPKPTCSCHVPSCHQFRKSIKSDGSHYPKKWKPIHSQSILMLKKPCWKTWIVGTRKEQKSPLCGCQLTAIWNHETCNIHNIVCLWLIYRKPQKFLYICFFLLLNYCWKTCKYDVHVCVLKHRSFLLNHFALLSYHGCADTRIVSCWKKQFLLQRHDMSYFIKSARLLLYLQVKNDALIIGINVLALASLLRWNLPIVKSTSAIGVWMKKRAGVTKLQSSICLDLKSLPDFFKPNKISLYCPTRFFFS